MDASCYLTCLWPGLAELWYRGRWSALPSAVAFGVALNSLLVARFVYPEWLAPSLVRLACWIGVAIWLVLTLRAASRLPALLRPRSVPETRDRYSEAWKEYLQGRWHEAEAVLAACLEVDPRDCQSLLLLAGVYRHTDRFEAAENTLKQLSRLETADAWWLERQAEEKRLARDQPSPDPQPSPDSQKSGRAETSDATSPTRGSDDGDAAPHAAAARAATRAAKPAANDDPASREETAELADAAAEDVSPTSPPRSSSGPEN